MNINEKPYRFGGIMMENYNVYQQIAERTQGDIYVGVVGPVRTGKSTFIKRFMDLLVLPNIGNQYQKDRARDELPQSSAGRTIMTTEPKFVPNEAVEITVDSNVRLKVRMVDCVGYLVKGALGYFENNQPRMVSTPWFDHQIPFEEAEKIVDDEEDEKEMTPEEKAKMWKMIQMMGGIEKKSITKQIEGR